MEDGTRKRRTRCMPALTRQDDLAGSIIARLAQAAGQEIQFRLVELWSNWKLVMGPLADLALPLGSRGHRLIVAAEDNMAQQELSFCTDEILARANSFLEEKYFTECQVKLRLGQKVLRPGGEAPAPRPAEKTHLSGRWLDQMDPDSPVARCYRAFVERGEKEGQ